MRNKIKEKLLEIDSNVFYGVAPESFAEQKSGMDCIVFGISDYKKKSQSSMDLQGTWYVIIVREDYIPESVIFDVIEKVEAIPGLRLTSDSCTVDYLQKGKTDTMVEALRLNFTRTIKSGC